jgi:hypothetical protein
MVLQQLWAGPLGAYLDAFGQSFVDQGYASSTGQYMLRLLADLSSWLQRYALTAADLHEQRVRDFLQERYDRCRPHRNDRPVLKRLLTPLRAQGVIPGAPAEPNARSPSCIERD